MRAMCTVIRSAILIVCCSLLGGCVSTELVKSMLKDIDRLKEDNATLQQQVKDLDRELSVLKETAEDRSQNLGGSAGDASGKLESGGVGNTAEPAQMSSGMTSMQNENRPVRLTGEDVYAQAQALYTDGKFREAYQLYNQASVLNPDSEFQARCYYWMGECMFAQGAYQQALDHFGTVFGQYGTTSKAADALLKIGFTYGELSNYNGARQALNEFIKRFPDHRAVPLAKERLDRLAELETGKAVSN
ncbi:tetratricopeptide repeat protein [bacterium]|nr:tetratricopeptide repeat protein [candidate division CSSED10-310 bacterium]